MLEGIYLTKSKIRRELLAVLFSSVNESFYLSDLARRIKTSPGNIQRELARFIKDGLVKRQEKGKFVFYSVNGAHVLFPEIQSLVQKTVGIEPALRTLVESDKDVKLALLYGSFAKAEEHGESDIDLLVVSAGRLKKFYSDLSKLESRFGREINPTVYSPSEFKKRITERNTFLLNVLEQPHRILKGSVNAYWKKENS